VFDNTEQPERRGTEPYYKNELRELNQRLLQSRDVLRALFDSLQDGLLLIDEHGYVQEINEPMATLFGSTPHEIVGNFWESYYQQQAPHFPGHLVFNPPDDHSETHQRVRYTCPSGHICILDLRVIMLQKAGYTANQVILHVVDVTEQIQFQERMLENERFAANGKLAARVAHEINTPLQAIQTAIAVAQRSDTEQERTTFLTHAQEEVQRVGHIVRQLLDLYRADEETTDMTHVNNLIKKVLVIMGTLAQKRKITIEHILAPELPLVRIHADELRQVLVNLIVNAFDSMESGGNLMVRTGVRERSDNVGNLVFIAITDDGCGIPPQEHERIFAPFVTTKKQGAGLGLAITRQIVQEYGGRIQINSQPGKGTTVTILFPLIYRRRHMPAWVWLSKHRQ
jgi:PAS domain S-box-containing protein